MWNHAEPMLPGYEFAGCNRPGRDRRHEIGSVRIAETSIVLWALRMNTSEVRSRLIGELPAALRMHSVAGVLARFNEALAETGEIRNATEIALMQIDVADHTLTMACAGPSLPVLRTAADRYHRWEQELSGLPLGMVPELSEQAFPETIIQLEPGTCVVWVSGYTTTLMNSRGELYGFRGLPEQVMAAPPRPQAMVDWIVDDIDRFLDGSVQRDDICLICCQRTV